MEIMPEPKNVNDKLLEFLKELMGEDGLTFLDLDNAITAVKQGHWVWQAPFAIGLRALPLLYHWGTDSRHTAVPDLALLVLALASQVHVRSEDMAISDLVNPALEPLEAKYNSLTVEIHGYGLGDEQARMLFHIRFALGVLLLLKGDEERAKTILRQMAATRTTRRGQTWSSEGLGQFDVGVTKALAAIIFQDFYEQRQEHEMALYLLTEVVASNGPGPFSESLLEVVPGLLESFAEKCERANNFGEWVDLFDRAAGITEICGEADTSGDSPSNCKKTSPQFLAWKFGQLVARFAIRNGPQRGNSKQLLPLLPRPEYQDDGTVASPVLWECGEGWGNGTMVASLLCEYDEHRNWRILRQQYVSMWEALPRYQWLSLCEAGTQTDLYWAMRIGFADQMLSATEQIRIIQLQTEPSPITRDIEMTKDIASTTALWLIELRHMLEERLPPGKREVRHELQQRLSSVWSKLPTKVVDTLVKAENYYRTGVDTDNAKVWFNKAVEASLNYCLVEPLVSFTEKRVDKRIAICFPPPRGVERKTSYELRKLSLLEWSDVFETLSVPADKSLANLGAKDLNQFMKEHFGELSPPALKELSWSLRDFCCFRKDAAHYHIPRHEEERQELEQMRELVLGIKRPSIITQIFQLFTSS
jgi:hypothetical protein